MRLVSSHLSSPFFTVLYRQSLTNDNPQRASNNQLPTCLGTSAICRKIKRSSWSKFREDLENNKTRRTSKDRLLPAKFLQHWLRYCISLNVSSVASLQAARYYKQIRGLMLCTIMQQDFFNKRLSADILKRTGARARLPGMPTEKAATEESQMSNGWSKLSSTWLSWHQRY